jgi:hypothetical protein
MKNRGEARAVPPADPAAKFNEPVSDVPLGGAVPDFCEGDAGKGENRSTPRWILFPEISPSSELRTGNEVIARGM